MKSDEIDPDQVRAFQAKHGLEETGEIDDTTKARIIEDYGC
jgi:peptidoglycan hydrolase-like protein with peptidoglycan-binding domain